ncbi:MAG: hypothetical protein ACWGHO_00105 [Candidatus Moraniibacteriota bacterium]
MYGIGDILHFERYCFTDTGEIAEHFGLVLLPPVIIDLENSLLCSVVTSQPPKYFYLELLPEEYDCFRKKTFVCFNRRDINSIGDLSKNKQPRGKLKSTDFKKAFKIIKGIHYGNSNDTYLVATIVREWKKIIKSSK